MNDAIEMLAALLRQPSKELALNALDILIVAYAIYRLLVVVKGTRAMQMGVGLVLVFVLHQLSRTLGLMTLFTVLDTLLSSIVLIVVVIFQADIRRALMRFGRRPLFARFRTAQEAEVVEEVTKAANQLAHDRVGALIVFERDAALDEFIEGGTKLDAAVSSEMLQSIFIPSGRNPLHDGAAVLREGRLWLAGTFLPLTANPRLDRNLGTRHRAAIGISEETDAVVVVVSEERGEVSLCFDGNIVRNVNAANLRQTLLGLFSTQPRRASKRPDTERTSLPPSRPSQQPAPAAVPDTLPGVDVPTMMVLHPDAGVELPEKRASKPPPAAARSEPRTPPEPAHDDSTEVPVAETPSTPDGTSEVAATAAEDAEP